MADKEIAWTERIIIARDGPGISERYERAKNGGLRLPYICDTRSRVTGWDAAPAFTGAPDLSTTEWSLTQNAASPSAFEPAPGKGLSD